FELAVKLRQPDREPLRLVRLRRRQEPQHERVEPGLGRVTREVSSKGLRVDPTDRAQRRQLLQDHLAAPEYVTVEIRCPVACLEVLEIARLAGGHAAHRESATIRIAAVRRRSPPTTVPAASAAAPNESPNAGTPLPIVVMSVMRDLLPVSHDTDGDGPATIGRRDHFSPPARPSTPGWCVWYERTIGSASLRRYE